MTTYQVRVVRGEVFWLVHVPEIDRYTQARNLGEVEPMARDLIAVMKEVDAQSFALEVSVELPEEVAVHLQRSRALREESDRAKHLAAQEVRVAAKELRERGLTVRDIGVALDVSYQRAHQLISVGPAAKVTAAVAAVRGGGS